ncbi:MAG TPA: methyl-accepting chemotaxis protein [bacterium]|nr:methyl-accepting chemotaxis protein [bacterium]
MIQNIRLKYKILSIPLTIFAIFIIGEIFTQLITYSQVRQNEVRIDRHLKGWDLYQSLSNSLTGLNHSMGMIRYRGDDAVFSASRSMAEEMQARIRKAFEEGYVPASRRDSLNVMVQNYYENAKDMISQADMVRQSGSADAVRSGSEYVSLKERLDTLMQSEKQKLAAILDRTVKDRIRTLTLVSLLVFLIIVASLIYAYYISRPTLRGLQQAIEITEKMAKGDLSADIQIPEQTDEIGMLIRGFDSMMQNQRKMTAQIKEGANSLAAAASQISASVTEIAAAATETASASTETSTTVEEVRQTAMDSNRKAKNVSESAQKAVDVSQTGEKAVNQTVEGMNEIEAQMASIAESIMKLSEHGQAIGGIMATVENIAEQSRLLAVNASIEAVKAGEQGKGFVVVAQEVRNLAEQSKQATQRVRSILDDIQKSTSEAVMKTEQGSKAVESGVKQSMEAGEAIQRLASSVTEAAQATTQIAVSSQEQLVGMDQVVSAMESIKQASNQNVSATKQVESATHILSELGQELKQLIEQYKI